MGSSEKSAPEKPSGSHAPIRLRLVGPIVRLLSRAIAAAVVIVAVMVGVVGWRLSAGPIELGFLTSPLVRALTPADGSFAVEIDRTVLQWDGARDALNIRVLSLRAKAEGGAVLASAPEVGVGLSLRALVRGQIAPRRLEANGLRVSVLRKRDGGLGLALGETSEEGNTEMGRRLLAQLLGPPGRGPLGYLERIDIVDTDISLFDPAAGTILQGEKAYVSVARDAAGLTFAVTTELPVGRERSRVSISGIYVMESGQILGMAMLAGLRPAAFARHLPGVSELEALDLPLSGSVRFEANLSGVFRRVLIEATSGAGRIVLPAPLGLAYDVRKLSATAQYDSGQSMLRVSRLAIELGPEGGPSLELAGSASGLDGNPTVKLEATLRRLATDEIGKYWPTSVAKNPRQWIVENLSKGSLTEARLNAEFTSNASNIRALVPRALSGSLRYSGLTVNYLDRMPQVQGVEGTARFDLLSMTLDLATGTIGDILLESGKVLITDFDKVDERIDINVAVRTPVSSALALIDSPPLKYASRMGIAPAQTGGQAEIRLRFRFPLIMRLRIDDVEIAVEGKSYSGSVKKVAFDQDLTAADLVLRLDRDGMDVSGNARLGMQPIGLQWRENFSGKPFSSRFQIRGEMSEVVRESFGMKLGPILTGPIGFDAAYTILSRGEGELTAALDLREASASVPALNWEKKPGQPQRAEFELGLKNDKPVRLPKFVLLGEAMTGFGRGTFHSDGRLEAIEFDRLAFGRTDVRGRLTPQSEGAWRVRLSGDSLDATRLLRSNTPSDSGGPDLQIEIGRLAKVWFGPDRGLQEVGGNMLRHAGDWKSAQLSARVGEGAAVALKIDTDAKGQQIEIASDDAGATLRAFDIFDNMIGGQLRIEARADDAQPGKPLVGTAVAGNFRIVKAPFLVEALAAMSLGGLVDAMQGDGVVFEKLTGRFALADERLKLEQVKAYGGALGVTAEGTINLDNDTAELTGTIVPAYTLNSLIGRIPILGTLITGERGGAIFAATYRTDGPLAKPNVSVSVLSALAPGFLRNLFGLLDGTVKSSDSVQEVPQQSDRN
jgi:AsmA-like C-terminal region/Protein of unknown function